MVTEDDILELAKDNPALDAAIRVGRAGGLIWEDTMLLAVKVLTERDAILTERVITLLQKYGGE